MKQRTFRYQKPQITQIQTQRAARESAPFGRVATDNECGLCQGRDFGCRWCQNLKRLAQGLPLLPEEIPPMNNMMPVALLEWRSMKRNTLRGFAKVRIGKSLTVSDVSVHTSHGRRWASMPSKPIVSTDGQLQRDEVGKVKYVPILQWDDKETADRFSEAVIAAVEAKHPGETQADG